MLASGLFAWDESPLDCAATEDALKPETANAMELARNSTFFFIFILFDLSNVVASIEILTQPEQVYNSVVHIACLDLSRHWTFINEFCKAGAAAVFLGHERSKGYTE
jgi:hypothetical protein